MQIQVGDLVEWRDTCDPYDIGIVIRVDYKGYPYIWWAHDQEFGHCHTEYIGEHLFIIGGSHENR